MNLYAHAVCYLLLIFIVLIMANHEECWQFAIRKWRNCYILSGIFVLYDMWIAVVNITFVGRRNRSILPIELYDV